MNNEKIIFLFTIFADRNLKNIYIMTINGKKQVFTFTAAVLSFFICEASAQTFKWYQTTENNEWKQTKVRLNSKGTDGEKLNSDATAAQSAVPFRTFGTTFNEQDWKAFSMLKEAEQDEIMKNLFSPDGDLHFTRGRISMNANDYALGWYSCDSVDGDFELKHFNIDRDKTTIIPLIHHAQKYNSQMRQKTTILEIEGRNLIVQYQKSMRDQKILQDLQRFQLLGLKTNVPQLRQHQ